MKKKLAILIMFISIVSMSHAANIVTVGGGVNVFASPWGYIYDDVSEFSAKFGGNILFNLAILTEIGKTKQYTYNYRLVDYPRRNAIGFAMNLGYGVFGGMRNIQNIPEDAPDELHNYDFGFLGHSAVVDLDFCYKTLLNQEFNDLMIQVGLTFKPEVMKEIIKFTMPSTYLFAPQTGLNFFIGGDFLYRPDGNKSWSSRFEKPKYENLQITVGGRIRAMVGPLWQSDYGIVEKNVVGTIEICAEIAFNYYNHF